MNAEPKLPRLILSSPWFLLIFLVVPAAVISTLKLHVSLPLVSPQLLLANNICFAFLVACRLIRYLLRLNRGVRYGAGSRSGRGFESLMPCAEARGKLAGAGFNFVAGGGYAEKRDLGYLGTVVFYGGLLLLLATGSLDNLRQFAGVLLDGPGPATKLSDTASYGSIAQGPLAAGLKSLPQMRITNQILPDSTYPKGATEILLVPEQGNPVSTVLIPGVPFGYEGYEFSMTKLVFQPELVIKTRDSQTLFDAFVKLDPLVQKRGDFSFYGVFAGSEVVGGAYYQPEKSLMMVVITRNGKKEVADMQFQVDQQVTTKDYILSCAKMGQWSEIHVVRSRHKSLLWLGGALALLGLALRIAVRPQRVWLEETAGGCRVQAVGKAAPGVLG